MLKVFLSCVSAQFKACRDALASDLRAIGCEVRVQEDFQQGPGTLLERLEEYVAGCDRVIALVGDAYGFDTPSAAAPSGAPARSYTQWEYFFALGERLDGAHPERKALYAYFASDAYLGAHAVAQSAEQAARQQAFVQTVKDSGKFYGTFDSLDGLCRLVLRDGWRMTERPHRPRKLPYDSLGVLFKGREGVLAELHARLRGPATQATAIVAKQAIHGLGGVGKTRLAVEYALRYQDEYCALLFVPAETPAALNSNLAALCDALVLNLPEREVQDEQVRVGAALRWLGEHSGWLLVLDNVDTPPAQAEVGRLLAQLQGGHVLVTSRLSHWGAGVDTLELDVLGEDDAVAFLLERTRGRRQAGPADEADARVLARELGWLALALEQAGAFIARLHESLGGYLRRWRERETKVREWHDEALMHYPRSVAVTWDTSVSQLDAGALALLRLLCWLAPEPIPRALLETEAARQALGEGVERLVTSGERARAEADFEEALAALEGFSLVKWEGGDGGLRLHRLVQEVTRERLTANERTAWLGAMLAVTDAYLPNDPPPWDVRAWPRWDPMRVHVAVVVEAADDAGIPHPTSRLMDMLGGLLKAKGVWAEAEALRRRALAIDEASYGPDYPEVAIRLNNVAALLQATNRLGEAEPLMRRALAIDEASYGPDHPNVATALNNLAQLLKATNRLGEPEPLMRRALAIDEASYGPDHPNVARDLNNLATLLQDTNRLDEAEPLMRRALAIDKASYGPDHPTVASVLNNLAQLLGATNRLGEAEPLMRRALAIDEASYGPDHPKVATRLNNLAGLLQATSRLAEAEPLMRRVVQIFDKSLGAEHPNVATALNNLAALLQATNRLGEAEPLMRRALAIDEASYGPDHPDVARAVNNLAQLLKATNRLGEAEPLMRRALAIAEASYGPDHPNVATNLNNLAQLLRATNRLGEAEPLMRRALAIDEASYGPDHPNVARDLNNLATLLEDKNRRGETEPLMRRVVQIFEKSLGADHPKVASALNNLAALLQATTRLGEAEPLMRRAVEIFLASTQATGHEHPGLRTVVANYTDLLEQMGRSEDEVQAELQALAARFGVELGAT